MAAKLEDLLLEYMRRFDTRQARCEDALRDMSARLSLIKAYLASMHGDLARHRDEIETTKSRLDRIERRLDLADAPACLHPPTLSGFPSLLNATGSDSIQV